jgi:hypothetical protein
VQQPLQGLAFLSKPWLSSIRLILCQCSKKAPIIAFPVAWLPTANKEIPRTATRDNWMADRFHMAFAEVQDSSGGVGAGWKLNFYEAGTSTRLDTYSNDTLATANANPVIADSGGRFGDIFVLDQDYKVVLTDADDVQISSNDPVRGSGDNLLDDTVGSTLSTTGSADAYALTVNRTITAYANGDLFVGKANFGVTGAATLNVTGGQLGASALGAKTIKKRHDQDVASGDIENGQWCVWKYDGTNMQLLTPVATARYVDPITTRGDMIRGDSSGNVERFALGTTGKKIGSDGTDLLYVDVAPTIQVFTSSDTYTKPAGLIAAIVEVVGSGGGGGGGVSAGNPGGGGAGSGAYTREHLLASAIGSTETVTIGAAGTAGTAGNNGVDGADCSFGTLTTALGGIKGLTAGSGGAGGAAGATGDINSGGGGGGNASLDTGSTQSGGIGGASYFGSGSIALGSGGTGGSGNATGIAGTTGVVIVTEYY